MNGLEEIDPIEMGGLAGLDKLLAGKEDIEVNMIGEEAAGSSQRPGARTFAIARRQRLVDDDSEEEEEEEEEEERCRAG